MVDPVLIGVIISGCISLANLVVSVFKSVKLKSACCKWIGCFEIESEPLRHSKNSSN
jgi:hypothetical protein